MENVIDALRILKRYVDDFEERDPQYKAIKRVVEKHGLKALGAIVGNALVSYRLKGTGEEYWTSFGEFFVNAEPSFENLIKFLKNNNINVAQKEQKVKRLMKVRKVLEEMSASPMSYTDLNRLTKTLARVLGKRGVEKTIVFAGKMAYYAFKAAGVGVEGDVPVPMDSRLATLTCAAGLVEGRVEEIMGPKRDLAVKAWSEAAKRVELRTLHLDALLWLPARGLRRALCSSIERGRELFERNLEELGVKEAKEVAELLIKKPCC